MDSIKRFFANFKKHGSITKTTINNLKSNENNTTEVKGSETQSDKHELVTNGEYIEMEQPNKSTKEIYQTKVELVKIPELHSQETKNIENKNESVDKLKNTQECLKEFDEILEEINKDFPKECGSLDEIDDVLNSILTEEDLIKEESKESLNLEIPRFDIQDLIHGFDSYNEDVDPINLDEFYDPDDLVIINVPPYVEENNQSKQSTVFFMGINKNAQEFDVISISSDDNQDDTHDENIKETHDPKTDNPNNVNYKVIDDKPTSEAIKLTEQTVHFVDINTINEADSDVISINSEDSQAHTTNLIPEDNIETNNKEINIEPTNINDDKDKPIIKNGVFNDDSDNKAKELNECKPENVNSKNKEITDKPKTINNEKEGQDKNILEVKVIDDSDNDCGYHSSDFEFITEDEAKMVGLIVNFNSEIPKRKVNKLKRVKTRSVDNISGHTNILNAKRICPEQRNAQDNTLTCGPSYTSPDVKEPEFKIPSEASILENCSRPNNLSGTDILINGSRQDRTSLRSFRRVTPELNNRADIKTQDNENKLKDFEHLQNDFTSDMYNKNLGAVIQINTETKKPIEVNNRSTVRFSSLQNELPVTNNTYPELGLAPEISKKKYPENNEIRPRSLQENVPSNLGPRSLQGNVGPRSANVPDTRFQRWRDFHRRNLNQLISDNSYRENHRLIDGEEYHGLFNPNLDPLPSQRIRPMENKSTMSSNMMLVEYNGVGFDLQMWRDNESVNDEVKAEANESAQKILEMYPRENRRRRRRRF